METPPPPPPTDVDDAPQSSTPPPPSIQTSNRICNERSDFENDAGGYLSNIETEPPAKRPRLVDDGEFESDTSDPDEDEGPLLGSGLAAELLEEGEIFDSESILSRNPSISSSHVSNDRDASQPSDSPSPNALVIQEDSNSRMDFEESKEGAVQSPKDTGPTMSPKPPLPLEDSKETVCVKPPPLPEITEEEEVLSPKPPPPPEIKETQKPPEPPLPPPTSNKKGTNKLRQYDEDDEFLDDEHPKRQTESVQIPLLSEERPLKPVIPSLGQEEFEVIDDLESDDEREEEGEQGSDIDSDDLLYDEDEIDALLDEGMGKGDQPKLDEQGRPLGQSEKVVLVDRGSDPFDILPENWVTVSHSSGMPLYLHRKTRVCTLSKPYFLGPSSARKHNIPLSAIPCLRYRRAKAQDTALEISQSSQSATTAEKCPVKTNDNDQKLSNGDVDQSEISTSSETTNGTAKVEGGESTNGPAKTEGGVPNLGVRVESAKDHEEQNSLEATELREYCQNLFEFKTITVKKFRTWKDRRKHTNRVKKVAARPSLPSSTKLIRCPIAPEKDNKGGNKRKEFVLNPAGKSDLCILHEYVQQALRVQPRYTFEELQNSQTPYSATVVIEGEKYGTGYSSSKKGAKLEAAKQTLAILIPEMNKLREEDKEEPSTSDLTLFDTIKIEDPRVTDLCNKAGQPGPFTILCECLKRNYGVGDTQVQMEMKAAKHQRSEFMMKVGKHEAKVMCKNKREGKQQAAQSILQKMHPHIHTWGSLLRLYDRSVITQQNKETESVIDLQVKSKSMPNKAILHKLKDEMRKLHSKHNEVKSSIKGRLQLPAAVDFISTNLGSVDL